MSICLFTCSFGYGQHIEQITESTILQAGYETLTLSEEEKFKERESHDGKTHLNKKHEAVEKLVVEKKIDAKTSIIINDVEVQKMFASKEFRDQFTALFGVDQVSVSQREPIVRITMLNDYIKPHLKEHLNFTDAQLSKVNL